METLRTAIARKKIERWKREASRPYDASWLIFRVRLALVAREVARQQVLGLNIAAAPPSQS